MDAGTEEVAAGGACVTGGTGSRRTADFSPEALSFGASILAGSDLASLDLLSASGLVRSALVLSEHISRLAELAARYADRQPDLADLCLIRLSELHPRYPVITTDLADFRVYRRGRREVIPLIHPPAL